MKVWVLAVLVVALAGSARAELGQGIDPSKMADANSKMADINGKVVATSTLKFDSIPQPTLERGVSPLSGQKVVRDKVVETRSGNADVA